MKEKYEKPVIESEEFSLEMMQAGCDANPGTIKYTGVPGWGAYPPCQGTCDYTKVTLS